MRQLSHTHTREYARGPDSSHAGPMVCMWATSPTCMSSGLRAYHGGNTHVQGLRCEQHTTSNIVVPKRRPPSPQQPIFSNFRPMGLLFGALHRPEPRSHRYLMGGITPSKPPTRRRRAARGLRMAQNPHRRRSGGRRAASKTGTVPIGAKKLAQHGPSSGSSAKKLAQHAQKRQIRGV